MAFRSVGEGPDLKSPKKQRYGDPQGEAGPPPVAKAAAQASPVVAPPWGALQSPTPPEQPQEAGGSNEEALAAPLGPPGEPGVTDAAHAFRELRVRPALGGVERGARAGSPAAPPERPSSPKKRKATYNIDKEFILKDDKVKRNTDTQGDISQARGQLGQLLFEFSQIQLNADLLEAIKRTESKTGRSLGSRGSAPGCLNRVAFELAVAHAAELLQAQLSIVEAHSDDAIVRSAVLRSYAVQAIAAFADEEWDSEEEAGEGEGDGCAPVRTSSDDENNDSNSRRERRGGSSSMEGPQRAGSADVGSQQSHDPAPRRPASAAGAHSPVRAPNGARQQPAAPGRAPGAAAAPPLTSPQRLQPAGSAAKQASSSFLPDAPSDAALEDTATAALREDSPGPQQQQQQQQQGQRAAAAAPAQAGLGRRREEEADDGHGMQQRMRLLSLEAEGSAQQRQASSCEEGEEGEGPADMVQSPVPVTSRRAQPKPPPPDERQEGGGAATAAAAAQGEPQGQWREVLGGGKSRALAAGEAAARPPPSARLQLRRQLHPQQPPAQQAGARSQRLGTEPSEGRSGGRASSGAELEPPKRQRRSGDLLPPLQEQARAAEAGAEGEAAAGAAAAAAHRARILGALRQHSPDPQAPQQRAPQAAGTAAGSVQRGVDAAAPPVAAASDATLRAGLPAAHSGSSVWGSTLVCADLTVNDVASQYWPFLRSAMQGQAVQLQEEDKELVASLVAALGTRISDAYADEAGMGRGPPAEVKSLVAATAFDDLFRAQGAAESSGASL